jgi:hypothetical protein
MARNEVVADDWRISSTIGRWAAFGPYYAMFPVDFVRQAVTELCREGGSVLDPFCGRGTVLYAARVTGRESLGVDINPVAWIFAQSKTDPEPDGEALTSRLKEISLLPSLHDDRPENEFQEWAWSPKVLAFLRAARRHLNWTGDRTDRTLMALILVYLHGKVGDSLSNQMRQSKSMAPDYSVSWWKERGLRPKEMDPVAYLGERIAWRYRFGVPKGPAARVVLGDARKVVPRSKRRFAMLLTSPPYCGVTNYRYDNWIRLWMLGEDPLPSFEISQRHVNRTEYEKLLRRTFGACAKRLEEDATVYIRTDSRRFTRDLTASIMSEIWPDRRLVACSMVVAKSQTHLFYNIGQTPGETDIMALRRGETIPCGFSEVPAEWLKV